MDYLTIILITAAGCGLVALAWLSGYEFGNHDATVSERALANLIRRAAAGKGESRTLYRDACLPM